MRENAILTDVLEPTNEPYAIKIAGIKMGVVQSTIWYRFCSVMPTNLYGINDNFHEENSMLFLHLFKGFTMLQ